MKKSFRKFQLWLKNHRSYKNFSKEIFVNNDDELQRFCDIKLQLLNQHVPQKIKYVWGNQMPFHDKATFWRNEEIRLRSNFMGNRTEKKIKILYNRQKNYSASLLRKSKRRYYENANIENLTDHKLFWGAVAPRCSVKKGALRNFAKIHRKTPVAESLEFLTPSLSSPN